MRIAKRAAWALLTTLLVSGLQAQAGSTLGGDEAVSQLPNGVAAGDITPTSVVLWARSENSGQLTFLYGVQPGPLNNFAVALVGNPTIPVKVEIDDLIPGRTYFYIAVDQGGAVGTGLFRTPASPGTLAGLRFGVSGDSRGDLAPYPSIKNAPTRNLDFFLNLGDVIYADYPSPDLPLDQATTVEEFRIKHNEVLSQRLGLNTFALLRRLTSFFTVHDDHDVANDFAGGSHPSTDPRFDFTDEEFINETDLYQFGLQAFHEYNPTKEEFYGDTGDPRTAGKRRLYRFRTFGDDAALCILDARSFRDAGLPPVADVFNPVEVAQFLVDAFNQGRTMLGAAQVQELKADLLAAQNRGITWKFVAVPEPIQNIGVILASDRFEGYAAERSELLGFIKDNGIENVVFIAADLHGTLVNNLSYQTAPLGPQIPVDAFEIITGPSAFNPPLGQTVVNFAVDLGILPPELKAIYDVLPRAIKDGLLASLLNLVQLQPLGYDPLGLQGSTINAELLVGGYAAVHVYGWTEFNIDAGTQELTVTTYGINPYTEEDLMTDPLDVVFRRPQVVSQFGVRPK